MTSITNNPPKTEFCQYVQPKESSSDICKWDIIPEKKLTPEFFHTKTEEELAKPCNSTYAYKIQGLPSIKQHKEMFICLSIEFLNLWYFYKQSSCVQINREFCENLNAYFMCSTDMFVFLVSDFYSG